MSILRQLLLSVTLAIAVILLGTFALSVNSARDYLSDQLQVQSEDGASALALSLSQPGNNNPVIQELLISALFDSGHFSTVRFTDPKHAVLFERVAPSTSTTAPQWFRSLLPLDEKSATRSVSDGWVQLGEVTLVASDSYAWDTLWRSCVKMILLIVVAGALWATFAAILVNWLEKKLLGEISRHVRAIGMGEFVESMPARVPELSGVVDALNQTRERVRASAEEQTSRIESLTLELNRDPITHLANRKYFINEFRRLLEPLADIKRSHDATAPAESGHLLVFRQRDLTAINRHMPREFVDQWLRSVADRVTHFLSARNTPGALLARLNGSDFVILLPGMKAPQATVLAESVRLELRASRLPVGEGGLCRWALALADYEAGAKAGDVLAQLDHALMRSESAGGDMVALPIDNEQMQPGTGEYAWKDAIVTALEEHRFSLSTHVLFDLQGRALHREATLALHSDAAPEPIPAALFIPPAVRLGLSAECDIQAVRLGMDWLVSNSGDLVVRVSLPSLASPDFLARLEKMFEDRAQLASRLIVEIDAHGLVEQYERVRMLCTIADNAGVRVGLRRLAQQFGAMAYLHTLPLAYVKLGGGFVGGMEQSPGSQQLAASVVDTARKLNIEVYAEDVPDLKTQNILRELGISIMCGPGVGELDASH